MSLDVYLYPRDLETVTLREAIFMRDNGQTFEVSRLEWEGRFPGRVPVTIEVQGEAIFTANITHNLGAMAQAAGLYCALWHPKKLEGGCDRAGVLIPLLREGLLRFTRNYLAACEQWPDAVVEVSR